MRKPKKAVTPAAEIVKAYNSGASMVELKAKFGIATKAQLAKVVLEAMIASGSMPALSRGRKKAEAPKEIKVAVNKRGTIILHKDAVIDAFKLKVGQAFTAKRHGKKIVLTMAG